MTGSVADRTRRLLARLAPDATLANVANTHVEFVATHWNRADEAAVALATTLLLRLDDIAPVIHLRTPTSRTGHLPRLGDGVLLDALADEHSGFASANRLFGSKAAHPALRITFGVGTGLQVVTDGWRVGVGNDVSSAGVGNPLAGAFAGVLAANEVFQMILSQLGVPIRPFRGDLSLWDLVLGGASGPPLPDVIDLDGVVFAACGGVASASAWSLGLLGLAGSPLCVDPDAIDLDGTNLNRHLTAAMRDRGSPKSDLFAGMLTSAGATARSEVAAWSSKHGADAEIVVASPDSDAVRRDVQRDLPRILLSAGTGDDGIYQVTRHNFLDGACCGCIARADLVDQGPVASAARRLGISESDLHPYLYSDAPLPADIIERTSVDANERDLLASTPAHSLLERLCAQVAVAPMGPAVSAPTLAAAPGVLAAVQLVKERMDSDVPLSPAANTLMTSIRTGPHPRWLRRREKEPKCECADDLYRKRYRERWGP